MDAAAMAMIRELKDREEIHECPTRYGRGIDRPDRDMLLSADHPDRGRSVALDGRRLGLSEAAARRPGLTL